MAKVKKAKIAIEDILLPIDEHPYEIPQNWCWVKHNGVLDISGGSQPAKSYFISEPTEGYIKLYQTRDYGDNPVPVYIPEKYATKTTLEGDILLARYGGSLGKVFRAHEGAYNVALAKVIKLYPDLIDDEYLYKYYFTQFYQDFCVKASKGRSAQAGFNRDDMNNMPFPLPPLAEQRRIVEQIESLFTKLDEAKEKALSVVESFESRKIAILNNAFNGLYSTDWREKHHCTIDDWKDRKINEICIPRAGFAFNSKKFTESGIQIIRMGNLYAGKLNLSRSPVFYDISDVDDNIIKRSMVHDGDILLTLTGTKYKRDYGYAVCIEGEHELLVNQRILCLSPTEKIDKEYLLYYLRSEIFRDVFFSNETGGVNQGNVSSKFVENIEIKLPSIEEQKEISKILKNILTKEEQAKELAEFVIEQIELMKKSILAKAYRGELGTNIATEESAIELLKSIL
ncbi:MAG: restriction endonuclease subunit S [Streptococcus sp.]|uniref:restriction endonuclease subunit S n=1 Tax=Streptococcus sp. TaxID=1306 RepID=UPI002F937824